MVLSEAPGEGRSEAWGEVGRRTGGASPRAPRSGASRGVPRAFPWEAGWADEARPREARERRARSKRKRGERRGGSGDERRRGRTGGPSPTPSGG